MSAVKTKQMFRHLLRLACREHAIDGFIAYFELGREVQQELAVYRLMQLVSDDSSDAHIERCLALRGVLNDYYQQLPD